MGRLKHVPRLRLCSNRFALLTTVSLLFVAEAAAFTVNTACANRCFRVRPTTPAQRSFSLYGLVTDGNNPEIARGSKEEDANATAIRPFHQNWWPVASVNSLKEDRPNQLKVLGMPLVAYLDKTSGNWNVLDDRCSHRFAPLSEGRLVDCDKIQCAYHGWEFTGDGTCTRVPQQPDRSGKANNVQSYAVREDLGIVWVWMDPETSVSIGESISLPINPLVRLCYEAPGGSNVFMRDLPYGMEILGENLLDLSHLPFAHHSVGNLNRSSGTELPTRMMSLAERKKEAQWETSYGSKPPANPVLPFVQAEIIRPADHDPIFMGRGRTADPSAKEKWTTTIGFFDPCHVRYRRSEGTKGSSGHVELFMCPTSEGRSRVFLFNCFERMLPLERPKSLREKLSPGRLIAKTKKGSISKVLGGHRGHMLAHKIFDGDGIFLHKQGNRMRVANLTFKDYSTPASADVLLNSYRRFLDAAAAKTRKVGLDSTANAVVGSAAYGDDAPREEMLDRYNTHTVHCPSCLGALKKARRKKSVLEAAEIAFRGATGSAIAALGTMAALRKISCATISPSTLGCVGLTTCLGFAGTCVSATMRRKTEKDIDGFIFEDYVHAEKD